MKKGRLPILLSVVFVFSLVLSSLTYAQINVLTVDINPWVSPGVSSIGTNFNTMGMALQAVDQGSDFNVTEMTPAAFAVLTAQQLSAYDLITVNNHPGQIAGGLGTNWHGAVNGRIMLNSHDAPRFKMTFVNPPHNAFTMSPAGGNPGPGLEPFGADELVRQAALWAGGVPGRTGLLILNDAARFWTVGGVGWNNPELALPAAWGITDWDQSGGGAAPGGGYTKIVAPNAAAPVYDGTLGVALSDVRFAINSISSFAANIVDTSFHSIFATYNPTIFTPTEVVQNSGVMDPGKYNIAPSTTVSAPDGTAITLVREWIIIDLDIKPGSCPNPLNLKSKGVTPVAIVGSAFDATSVDPATVTLEGVSAVKSEVLDSTQPPTGDPTDCYDCFDADDPAVFNCDTDGDGVDDAYCGDGIPDLVVYFSTPDLAAVIAAGDGECVPLSLEGALYDGTPVKGMDSVIIKRKGGKPAPSANKLTTTWGEIKNR
jgi:hypothetical protein